MSNFCKEKHQPFGSQLSAPTLTGILLAFFGDGYNPFSLTDNKASPPITRSFSTIEQAMDELVNARIWVGFHFRNSDIVAKEVGRKISRFSSPSSAQWAMRPPTLRQMMRVFTAEFENEVDSYFALEIGAIPPHGLPAPAFARGRLINQVGQCSLPHIGPSI